MRGVITLGVGFCVLASSCTAGLQHQFLGMRREIRNLKRQLSSDQVQQEALSNRILVLEERLRRPTARQVKTPAVASVRRPVPPQPRPAEEEGPPSLPVVKLKPGPAPRAAPPSRPIPEVPRLGPTKLYARGLKSFRARRLGDALAIFGAFLRRYPDHSLSDNSLYWSGRTLALQNKRAEALQTFRKLPRRYPTGNKVPDALVALAELLDSSGNRPQAQKTLARVVRAFPASEAAKEASRRLREMRR